MINSTRIGKIIQGVRGDEAVDLKKLKSIIKSVAQMMINYKEITECDLNPLLVTEDNRLYAVDIRIKC
jgi:acetyltransferase